MSDSDNAKSSTSTSSSSASDNEEEHEKKEEAAVAADATEAETPGDQEVHVQVPEDSLVSADFDKQQLPETITEADKWHAGTESADFDGQNLVFPGRQNLCLCLGFTAQFECPLSLDLVRPHWLRRQLEDRPQSRFHR